MGLTLVAAVGITACGSATQQNAASKDASAPVTWTASSLANWLENDNGFDGKGNVTNATCIHQQGNVWQCLGTWTPAEAGSKAEDPDPSLSESDIQAAIKQGTQRMTYQVTTSSDGTWIANPN